MERPLTPDDFHCKECSDAKWSAPTRNNAGLSTGEDATRTRRISCSCKIVGRLLHHGAKVIGAPFFQVASNFGVVLRLVPANRLLFSSDWAIDHACEIGSNYTVPENLRYHLLIRRFLARVDKAMTKRTRSPTGQPMQKESDGLMRLLECDLEDLERCIGNEAGGMMIIPLDANGVNTF